MKYFDRVKTFVGTAGTGDIEFGTPWAAFLGPADAGAADGDTTPYILTDGLDFEEGILTIGDGVTTGSRNVTRSKIGGVVGTDPLDLSGNATLFFTIRGVDVGRDGIDGASDLTTVRIVDLTGADPATAYENGDALDGKVLVTNDLVLRAKPVADADNGVYVVPASGAASRTTAFAAYDDHCGRFFGVKDGTSKGKLFGCTSAPGGTLGTTAIAISEFAAGGEREKLTANRDYYVRGDGDDSHNGLSNTSGGAFLTKQKAVNVVVNTLDLNGYAVVVHVGSGTATDAVLMDKPVVGGTLTLQGDTSTPSNVVVAVANDYAINVLGNAELYVKGFKFADANSFGALRALYGGKIYFDSCDFGAVKSGVGSHVTADYGGQCLATGNYAISTGAVFHVHCNYFGRYAAVANTITLTGTPAFSAGFVGNREASVVFQSVTFSGLATGPRYVIHRGGLIDTLNAGDTYLPGNAAGSIIAGGIYDTKVGGDFFPQAGSFVANTAHIYTDANLGLVITGQPGASKDFGYFSAAGFELLANPTGTANLELSSGGVGSLGFCTPAVSGSFAKFAGSTTAKSLMRLTTGSAPTSPADGDVWLESNTNTGLKIRINGVTKTVTLS
ncbi:hypothetical protein [Bradyrhizobium sp. G127]|uniref:hypothetical protein n=1 Tax=Bradyrhizobium sp. G127 TaxID=2904800 RepID=UPI001F2F6F73|nr:hypothetical protein [Bradyrhizobium sp. G127]MCF2522355.1 hypothetical protein [Bradyrhizobium sp. G127]